MAAPRPAATIVPQHVAVIMDGNGRWAGVRGLPRTAGHRAGTENIRAVIRAFGDRGVRYLTLFAFSTENWSRPRGEVSGLMRILARTIRREVKPLHEAGVRLHYIGRIEVLPKPLQRQIAEAVDLTRNNTAMMLCVAFNYGARAELVDAVRRIIADGIPAEAIDEETISRYLYTAGIPDPDLIIRTGGEWRLSNFLLWQCAYAEYHATPTYWPDFSERDVDEALAVYQQRLRKFGALPPAHPAHPAARPAAPSSVTSLAGVPSGNGA